MIRHFPPTPGPVRALLLLFGSAGIAAALQLRDYSAARHDRFTGFPAVPAWNDAAWFSSRDYAGIGWAAADSPTHRQFALVSPGHVLCATHYQPGVGSVIRFLNRDGVLIERTVAARFPVPNELDQNSDLAVLRLSAPLAPADKVAHFPYLDLSDEAAYLNTAMVVFGWEAKAGRGRIAGFESRAEPGVKLTRMLRFDYVTAFGQQDDCRVELGDSGSPSFAVVAGRPAVVGLHSLLADNAAGFSCYDTFVPHYVAGLNLLMAPDGYQMTPANPDPVALAAAAVPTPAQWRQSQPGVCRFDLTNSSPHPATNPAVVLRFPADRMPDTLDAPGWVVAAGDPGEMRLHRATFDAATTIPVTATWADVGLAAQMVVELTMRADGSAEMSYDFSRTIAPAYAVWAAGLAHPAADGDDDADGLSNLLEYAAGGDPTVASRFQPGGAPLQPVLRVLDGVVTLEFPVREDAAARGLVYQIEWSDTLVPGAWTTAEPPEFAVEDGPLVPPAAGFRLRTVSFDATGPRRFCRVRVELDEDG